MDVVLAVVLAVVLTVVLLAMIIIAAIIVAIIVVVVYNCLWRFEIYNCLTKCAPGENNICRIFDEQEIIAG
jgi:uncharacterized protein (DUF2062 family)